MQEPCVNATYSLQLVIAVFSGLSTLLGVFLAHRRQIADKERRRFYQQMRMTHGLYPPEDVEEWQRQKGRDH